ncbi:MAG: 16S rRNA (guanine(527)-N(7))-methyltransferase RsmG [Oscillospiraceae bacterium]|nr:16S rRNA (guanine(527)-N(7))-methyltransferase RsmG [Oscillospiraceae bacterium]
MISKELFFSCAKEAGLALSDETFQKFDKYAVLLKEYNEKVNLTAITDADGITVKHFADSLFLLKHVNIKNEAKVCDVGTGAGFPGMCLLLARSDLRITLFDSVNKKLEFIRFLCNELDVQAEIINIRAENAGKQTEYREKFDIATARAVASLNKLSEYCLPLVKPGGYFAPMKAPLSAEEKKNGKSAAATLGAKLRDDFLYELPTGDPREILVFEKISQTPPKYPRNSGIISKNPLQ